MGVFKSAPAEVPPTKPSIVQKADINIGIDTSLELYETETTKTEKKGNIMKLEHSKTSVVKIHLKALEFLDFAWLMLGHGAGLT